MHDFAHHRTTRPAQGFTLVELMVTVAVLGILAMIAVPSMTSLVSTSRVKGQAEEVTSLMQVARSEAIRRNQRVTACASASGTSCSASANRFVVFSADPANPAVMEIVREITLPSSMTITGPGSGVVFKASGITDGVEKYEVSTSADQRCLTVSVGGVITVTKGGC